MFQTFSGTSRRPRQVNLSGRNLDPFAASSWSPAATGTQKTVANAQQERQQRQLERDRLNSAKNIQRVWRGHTSRTQLANARRSTWDQINRASPTTTTELVELLRLLVFFFKVKRLDDVTRLFKLSLSLSQVGYTSVLTLPELQRQLPILAGICLRSLSLDQNGCSLSEKQVSFLNLLVYIIDQRPDAFPKLSYKYYKFLAITLTNKSLTSASQQLLLNAVRTPLVEHIEPRHSEELILNSYASFALAFLATPELGEMGLFASFVDINLLSAALVKEFSSFLVGGVDQTSKLWLLAHFIEINHLQRQTSQDPRFLKALSLQLSSSSSNILSRMDYDDPEILHGMIDNDENIELLVPLPPYVKDQLFSLVNQASISGLLAKFNIDSFNASSTGQEDASLLASYALTLLRIFHRRGDEIRMWLYRGSMTSTTDVEVPALKFFWQAMNSTAAFNRITNTTSAALELLKPSVKNKHSNLGSSDDLDRQWRTILLFLELYNFVLRFTDDEEFLSGGNTTLREPNEPVSRIRESALPLGDIERLALFLKNLAFTMYYYSSELSEDTHEMVSGGLSTYFGTSTSSSHFQNNKAESPTKIEPNRPFAGIAGMTVEYVRMIVTGVMRMIYERDSRRQFLQKNHWLMTAQFDMEGFIPAVVMEEERQNQVREEGEENEDEQSTDNQPTQVRGGLVGMAGPRNAIHREGLRRQQQKVARRKALAAVGPRLEVLQHMPYVIPFETRVQIFKQFVHLDQTRRRNGRLDPDAWRFSINQSAALLAPQSHGGVLGRHHARIHRDSVFEDAYEQFYELGDGLKEPIQITFVDQFDTVEAGIDGGGVTKEFLTSVTSEAFNPMDGPHMFVVNDQNLLYPNPAYIDQRKEAMREHMSTDPALVREYLDSVIKKYEFLGRVIGKCMYEGILVDIGFAGFFLLKWATAGSNPETGYRANINDLRDLDEGLYQGLLKLKNYPGNVEDFGLDFSITDTISEPDQPTKTITRELMPNGSNIPVTNENRPLYVYYVARHRLQVQPMQQTQAFLRGLGDIIKPSWLSMFNQAELQTLIAGESTELDVEDLRRNTIYSGLYQTGDDGMEHPTIQLFWEVMKELDDTDRRQVLKYVTSTPRAPLLGFSQLKPHFSIRDAGADEERLPSTSTCVNLLKLPRYTNKQTLKQKLVYAINSGAGFDLS